MEVEPNSSEHSLEELPPLKTRADIQAWLIERIAQELWIEAGSIALKKPLRAFGMDSFSASVLLGDIAERMRIDVEPSLFDTYSTVEALTEYLTHSRQQTSS